MKRIFILLTGLYLVISQSMAVYYWYEGTQSKAFKPKSSFIISLILVEGKGFAWPYFAFFHKPAPKNDIQINIENYFAGYGYISKASHMEGRGKKILEQEFSLMTKGREMLSKCDFNLLNGIYPEWGDMVKDVYIPSIDLMIQGYQAEDIDNITKMQKAVNQLENFNAWMDQHWSGLAKALEKYGYKLMMGSEQKQNAVYSHPVAAGIMRV